MKTILSFFLASVLSTSAIMAQSNNLQKELESFVAKFETTYNAQNASEVANLYTDDAQIIRFDDTVFSGHKNIDAYYSEFFGGMEAYNKINIDDVVSLPGGNAYMTGHFEMNATVKANGNEMKMNGTYAVLSQKVNGDWKIHRMFLMMPTPRQGG